MWRPERLPGEDAWPKARRRAAKRQTAGNAASEGQGACARSSGSTIPDNPGMTALYLERYLNFGLTPRGAAVRQADHRHRPDRLRPLALQPPSPRARQARARRHPRGRRHRASNFRCHPIQETGKRPTAALDRNLAYLGLVEVLYGYPLDGVVLMTGCDKTTPACIMAAATVNIPAIVLSGGPMLNGWWKGERTGSGTVGVEGARGAGGRPRSTTRSSSRSSPPRRPRSAIATPWARPRP